MKKLIFLIVLFTVSFSTLTNAAAVQNAINSTVEVKNQENPAEYWHKKTHGIKVKILKKVLKEDFAAWEKANKTTKSPMAASSVISFILSVVGIFLPVIWGALALVVAFVLSIVALAKIRNSIDHIRGRGLAIAALVISSIFLFILLLALMML